MTTPTNWRVVGTYYEVCNCEAICPCRRQGDKPGGRSSYDTCDFVLSWFICSGKTDELDLSNLGVALAGRWDNAEPSKPGFPEFRPPWRVTLYVDDRGSADQQRALADIFLGRAGGTTLRNYAIAIGEVYAVRRANIELDHTPNRERIRIASFVMAETKESLTTSRRISCGIAGHDNPGRELIAGPVRVTDMPHDFAWEGRCGFATRFDYRS